MWSNMCILFMSRGRNKYFYKKDFYFHIRFKKYALFFFFKYLWYFQSPWLLINTTNKHFNWDADDTHFFISSSKFIHLNLLKNNCFVFENEKKMYTHLEILGRRKIDSKKKFKKKNKCVLFFFLVVVVYSYLQTKLIQTKCMQKAQIYQINR